MPDTVIRFPFYNEHPKAINLKRERGVGAELEETLLCKTAHHDRSTWQSKREGKVV